MDDPNSSGDVVISAKVPPALVDRIDAYGGDANRSHKLRLLLDFALAHAEDETFAERLQLRIMLDQLNSLARSFHAGTAPSGATWAATPDAMPDPARVAAPAVLACPAGALVIGLGGVLTVDAEQGQLFAQGDGGREHSQPLSLAGLARLAGELPPALLALAEHGPGAAVKLPASGITVARPGCGHLQLGIGGIALSVSVADGWRLAAEVTALLARRLDLRVGQALAAEAALAAPAAAPADQEVAR